MKESKMSKTCEHIEIRCLRDDELQTAYKIRRQYLDDGPFDVWARERQVHPDLFLACLCNGKLIGIAYGRPSDTSEGVSEKDSATLNGIAVVEMFSGNGYGSQLLSFFNKQTKRVGYKTVGVGSAGGYVDRFYMKNGYTPIAYMIRLPSGKTGSPDLLTKHAISDERFDGHQQKLYVKIDSLDEVQKRALGDDFEAEEVIAIVRKKL
jgi:GNAT superfamily N-acetyltransferase